MVSSVVVSLDGTPGAERALATGRDLAVGFGVPLLLFATTGDDEAEVRAYLDAVAARVAPGLGPAGAQTLLHRGFASAALADEARRRPGAVVCLAHHHDGGSAGTSLGPDVEDLIEQGGGPVVIVGPRCPADKPVTDGGRAVLLCADGSPLAASLEDVAVEWARALALAIELVTVIPRGSGYLTDAPVERVLHEVARFAFRLERRGVTVSTVVVDDGTDPAFAITRYAGRRPTAFIAASTHGHRHDPGPVVSRNLVRLVHDAPAPVLVARPTMGRPRTPAARSHRAGV